MVEVVCKHENLVRFVQGEPPFSVCADCGATEEEMHQEYVEMAAKSLRALSKHFYETVTVPAGLAAMEKAFPTEQTDTDEGK